MRYISLNKNKRFPFIILLKNNLITFLILFFLIFLLLFSNNNIQAAKEGINLWINCIIPSLLPFLIATELLSYTNFTYKLSTILNPIMKPIFNVSGIGAYILILGFISGYPIGAKLITNFKENNLLTNVEAERLLSFTNNSGPLFILGTIGISMYQNTLIGLLLLFTHILSALSVGFIFRFWKNKKEEKENNTISKSKINKNNKIYFSNIGEILTKSILSSINTIILIGGFVILFSVIISILNNSQIINIFIIVLTPILKIFNVPNIEEFIKGIFYGLIEITNGIKFISNIHINAISINICLTSFLLGLSGICVLFQVLSITSKSNISIKPYIIGKVMQAIFSFIYTFLFINVFPIFNLNL